MDKAEQIKQAEIDARFRLKDRIEVLRSIMGSAPGRDFIWWLLSEAKIFSSTFGEPQVMAYNEGKRAIGRKLFDLIQSDNKCWELFSIARKQIGQKTKTEERQ